MKIKHLFFSMTMVLAFFLSSAIATDKSLQEGDRAPKIETTEGINVVADATSEGKTILVSFWSPKKPASRIANHRLSKIYGENSDSDIEFISICTDDDAGLMQEVLRIDGTDCQNVYSYSDINSRVFKDYGVEEAPTAFLISAEGKILGKVERGKLKVES